MRIMVGLAVVLGCTRSDPPGHDLVGTSLCAR